MNHTEQYAASCFPDRWVILGKPLRPFCLGHVIILQRLGSPFLSMAEKRPVPTLADLLLAVFICSQPYERAERVFRRGLGLHWRLFAWRVKLESLLRPFEFARRFHMMEKYMCEGLAVPRYWLQQSSGPKGGSSPWVSVKVASIAGLNYSQREVLGMPLTQLHWELATLQEQRGAMRLMNEIEEETISAIQRDRLGTDLGESSVGRPRPESLQ